MALPLLLLVHGARNALKHWRSLPTEEREQLRETATKTRRLAVELAGPKAGKLLGDEATGVPQPAAPRDRDAVARELRDALAILAVAAGSGAAASLGGGSRKGKVLGRIADVGARQVRKRVEKPAEPVAAPSRSTPAAQAPVVQPAAALAPPPNGPGWQELSSEIAMIWGGTRPSPTTLAFEINLEEGRQQRMFATREMVEPDLEFLHIQTAIGLVDELDVSVVLAHAGNLVNGSLGHVREPNGVGIVTFGMKFPVVLVDRRELSALIELIHLLARTADRIEHDFAGTDTPDRF